MAYSVKNVSQTPNMLAKRDFAERHTTERGKTIRHTDMEDDGY
jgi:hypothetical protein